MLPSTCGNVLFRGIGCRHRQMSSKPRQAIVSSGYDDWARMTVCPVRTSGRVTSCGVPMVVEFRWSGGPVLKLLSYVATCATLQPWDSHQHTTMGGTDRAIRLSNPFGKGVLRYEKSPVAVVRLRCDPDAVSAICLGSRAHLEPARRRNIHAVVWDIQADRRAGGFQ